MRRRGKPVRTDSAFTLIELMIVIAIVGILAAISIPKFADLVRKTREGATKGNLAAIRSAVTIYYGDQEGRYPADDLGALTLGGKYLAAIPPAHTPDVHAQSTAVRHPGNTGQDGLWWLDTGQWAYWGEEGTSLNGRNWGDLWVGCHHTDSKGAKWTEY